MLVDGSERSSLRTVVQELEESCPGIERWRVAPIWDIFCPDRVKHFPHKERYEILEDRVAVIIHSSGTTGPPKPICLTHGYLATLFYMHTLPVPEGRQTTQLFLRQQGNLRLMTGPLFYFTGLVCISECIFFRTPFLLAPDRPLTADLLSQIMSLKNPPKWGLIASFILEELSASEKGRAALSKLSAVNFGGAPLSQAAGDTISELVQLDVLYGSSEAAYTPNLRCEDPKDWNYLEWNPDSGARMEDAGDGLCELVITRTESRRCQGIFHTDLNLTEHRTGDLFRAHPSKPGLWHYQGRGDDIIVLNNGKKFYPTDAEKVIEAHPLVKHAVIVGQDRSQSALLIETQQKDLPKDWDSEWLHQTLRPTIDEANAVLPDHGKLQYNHVAFASEDKPFSLSPKGTLRRREIASMYQSVIDGLCNPQPTRSLSTPSLPKFQGSNRKDIEQWVQSVIAQILSLETVDLDDGIMALGMHSLQSVQLVQILQISTNQVKGPAQGRGWNSALIYQLDTPRQIAQEFEYQIHGKLSGGEDRPQALSEEDREARLTTYTWEQAQHLAGGTQVLLTGSTGELGTFLLDRMLRDFTITRIICLNRSSDAATRQVQKFRQKKLAIFWLTDTTRVEFKQSKLHEPYLGLDPEEYNALQKDVSIVIHTAWPVNINQSLASFEPHIVGVRRLLNFVESSDRKWRPQFHFVSSISVGARKHEYSVGRNSDILWGYSVVPQGYAESKFIAERLCEISSKRDGTKIVIHRVGQLGGPSNPSAGMWNTRDWFPALVRSSLTMQKLPDSLGSMQVDWLPIVSDAETGLDSSIDSRLTRLQDIAAEIMLWKIDTKSHFRMDPSIVYGVTDTTPIKWKEVAPIVAKACAAKIVSLDVWVQSLKDWTFEPESYGTDLNELPAAQLLDFFATLLRSEHEIPIEPTTFRQSGHDHWPRYDHQPRYERRRSRHLKPVSHQMMKIWLYQLKDWIPKLNIELDDEIDASEIQAYYKKYPSMGRTLSVASND